MNNNYRVNTAMMMLRTLYEQSFALETNDSWIAKRATRNVLKFIMDLARLADVSVIEGKSSHVFCLQRLKS